MSLTLAQANAILDGAFAKARDMKLKPLGIAVLDNRGVLVAYQGQDGGGLFRPDVARGKAHACLGMNRGGRGITAMTVERPHFGAALMEISNGRFVPVPGGVLVKDGAGSIIGAVGVSGDTSDNDEICAAAGIEAAGLKADTGA